MFRAASSALAQLGLLLLALSPLRAAANCDSNLLLVQTVLPFPGSTVTAGTPVFIQVQSLDACDNPLISGTVTARVSNGDPIGPFTHVGNGVWRATWVPFNAAQSSVNLNVVAVFAQGSVLQSGKSDIVLQLAPNAQVPRLLLGADRVSISAQQGSVPVSSTVNLTNIGGGTLRYAAAVQTRTGGNWLSVSPATGDAATLATRALNVTANPTGLTEGTYSGVVTITAEGASIAIPVTFSVTRPQASLLLTHTGLIFTAVEGGGNPGPQSFGVLNQGTGELNFDTKATTLSGGSWLTLSSGAGRILRPLQDVANVEVAINASSLTQGDYYAELRISSPGAINSPQSITALLKVLPRGSNPGPEVRPAGLVFTGAPGSSPRAETIRVTNLVPRSITFNSGSITRDGARWLTLAPSTLTTVPANSFRTLTVQPAFTGLTPGVRAGTVSFAFDDGTIRNVNVLSIVSASAPAQNAKGDDRQAAGCSDLTLHGEILSLPEGAAVTVGQPVPIEVRVADSCGNPLLGPDRDAHSAVTVRFSNNDPNLPLVHSAGGRWTGTWRPGSAANGTVIVSAVSLFVQGAVNQFVQAGRSDRSVRVGTGANVPIVGQSSLVHSASQRGDAPVAPGTLVTLYGAALGGDPVSAPIPLPTDVDGTQVLLGGQPLPILFSSAKQINAQIPYSLPVNTRHQIVVRRGTSLSVPEPFSVAAAQPGIFTVNQQGSGQGIVLGPDQLTIAAPGTPALRGQAVIIYCTGLGAVAPAVTQGLPAPASPLSQSVDPVTVQIGGQSAQVLFSGLSPGFAGLYQVNAVVPAAAQTGDSVPLTISISGQVSNTVTLAVR